MENNEYVRLLMANKIRGLLQEWELTETLAALDKQLIEEAEAATLRVQEQINELTVEEKLVSIKKKMERLQQELQELHEEEQENERRDNARTWASSSESYQTTIEACRRMQHEDK